MEAQDGTDHDNEARHIEQELIEQKVTERWIIDCDLRPPRSRKTSNCIQRVGLKTAVPLSPRQGDKPDACLCDSQAGSQHDVFQVRGWRWLWVAC